MFPHELHFVNFHQFLQVYQLVECRFETFQESSLEGLFLSTLNLLWAPEHSKVDCEVQQHSKFFALCETEKERGFVPIAFAQIQGIDGEIESDGGLMPEWAETKRIGVGKVPSWSPESTSSWWIAK